MAGKLMYKDDELFVWRVDDEVTMCHTDRGVALKFDVGEWNTFLTKMIVTAYNSGVGLRQGFNQIYGNVN